MFLSPHHFQQWDNCQQYALHFRSKSLSAFDWGLRELEINREGLANGVFSMLKCSGIFPGGTIFAAAETEGGMPSRVLRNALDPSVQTADVYLALPAQRSSSRNLAGGETAAQPARFLNGAVEPGSHPVIALEVSIDESLSRIP